MSDGSAPHIVVAAIVEREGRYLMVEESIGGSLCLNQPAGHWEPGETLIQGMCRETLEESAWEVQATGFLGVYEWQPPDLPYSFVRFAFIAQALRHHPERALDAGIVRALWLSADELAAQPARHRSPTVWSCIEDHRAGRCYPLDLIRHIRA